MKIIAVNGSHKKVGGVNQLFLDTISKGVQSEGAYFEIIRLSSVKINPCISCDFCQKNSEYACIYDDDDDFRSVYNKILEADVIIYSTPVYIFNISGLMKIFLDRLYSRGKSKKNIMTKSKLLFHDVDRGLLNKKFISIIISDNIENKTTKNIIYYFKSLASFFDYSYIGSIVRNGSFIFKSDIKKREKQNVNLILKNLEKAGKEIVNNKNIPRSIQRKINKRIIPITYTAFKLLKKTEPGRKIILKNISNWI